MRSYQSLVVAMTEILSAHNEALGEAGPKVDVEAVKQGLAKLGGTSEAALKRITWEDLEGLGVPRLLARDITALFREENPQGSRPKTITIHNAANAAVEDLVAAYDPARPTTPAAEELRKQSKGNCFVVFLEDGITVDREATVAELKALQAGEPPRERIVLGGRPVQLFRVGERPPQIADEHPLCKGVALRSDGTDEGGINWSAVALEVRQLLWLAVNDTRELAPRTPDDYHDIHERASRPEAMAGLRTRYQSASLKFDQLKQAGQLPQLKVTRSSNAGGRTGGGDPFHGACSGHARY